MAPRIGERRISYCDTARQVEGDFQGYCSTGGRWTKQEGSVAAAEALAERPGVTYVRNGQRYPKAEVAWSVDEVQVWRYGLWSCGYCAFDARSPDCMLRDGLHYLHREFHMKYANLGNTGLVVSRLAFGAMTFTAGNQDASTIFKVGAKVADQLVGRSIDAGVNFFDTADGYASGESETLLGAALKSRRDQVVIATKVGFRTGAPLTQSGLSRRHILWSVDQSLQRLDTGFIDVYIAHREDPLTPIEETLEALDAVVRCGKVRYLGFSNWSAWKVSAALEIQKARGLAPFTHGQMHYSLLGRDVERDVIPMMRRYGLGLTVWSPLSSGFLSGKYTRESLSDPDNRMSGFDLLPFDKEQGFRLVERLRTIGASRGASVAQVAIVWLLARPAVTSVLLGASKLSQLDDNLAAADVELTAAEIAELDAATVLPPVYPNWFIDRLADKPAAQAVGKA
jgi:aryl-alcohol dehydrogenase-like predicted oxidoreductase